MVKPIIQEILLTKQFRAFTETILDQINFDRHGVCIKTWQTIFLREFHKLQYLVYYRKSLIFAALVSLFAQIRQTRKQALILSCCP